MSESIKIDLMDLGGGHVDGLPATHIPDNAWAELINFYTYGNTIVRRNGYARLTETPHSEALTSIFALKETDGAWTCIVGRETGLSKLDGTGLVDLPVADGLTYATEATPWRHGQYKNVGYCVRRNTGTLKRHTDEFMSDAGIVAPTVAPTIVQGAAGALPAGAYYAVYTYYNSDTGAESDPSPASTVLNLAASKKIEWSALGVGTNGQVNARRLYRTLEDQQGEYYFVAQINDNFTTTYSDNVLKSDLGSQASFDNGLPPPNVHLLEFHKERAFLSDGRDVYPSEVGLPESYSEYSVIQVFPDDGHAIRALKSWGDRLVIGKTNAIHVLIGTDESNFAVQTLSDRHGIFSQGSVQVIEGVLFWFGGSDFFMSTGGSPQALGRERIKTIVSAIPDDLAENIVSAVFPALSWYVVSVPQTGYTTNRKVLVYDYRRDSWSVFTHPSEAPAFIGDFFTDDYEQVLYAAFSDGHLYQYNTGNADDGTAITARAKSKDWGFDRNGLLKGMRRLDILCTSVAADATVKVYRDGSATATSNRTTSLNQTRPWKRLAASTMGALGATVQAEITYAGVPPITISALSAELVAYRRSQQPV